MEADLVRGLGVETGCLIKFLPPPKLNKKEGAGNEAV